MKTTNQALNEYLSMATTDLNRGESLNKLVEKIHFLMKANSFKISKKAVKTALHSAVSK